MIDSSTPSSDKDRDPTRSLLGESLAPLSHVMAITVRQPWAQAILLGKDVENRGWKASHRGPLVIHAAAAQPRLDHRRIVERRIGRDNTLLDSLPLGAAIGVVDVLDCIAAGTRRGQSLYRKSQWADSDSEYYFVLGNPRAFPEPIPYRGALGLFKITDDRILSAVARVT